MTTTLSPPSSEVYVLRWSTSVPWASAPGVRPSQHLWDRVSVRSSEHTASVIGSFLRVAFKDVRMCPLIRQLICKLRKRLNTCLTLLLLSDATAEFKLPWTNGMIVCTDLVVHLNWRAATSVGPLAAGFYFDSWTLTRKTLTVATHESSVVKGPGSALWESFNKFYLCATSCSILRKLQGEIMLLITFAYLH